jgi:hypothetical protein
MTNTLKEQLKPLAQKLKFWYFIKGMDDADIFEFINDELFDGKISHSLTFENAKLLIQDHAGDLMNTVSHADQRELYDIVKNY